MNRQTTKMADLSVQEVADMLGLCTKSVRKLIRNGLIEAYRPGLRAFRVTRVALESYRSRQIFSLRQEQLNDDDEKNKE